VIYTLTKIQSKNTTEAEPVQYIFPVAGGLIYQVEFYFPPGSGGHLHLKVHDGGYQVWPSEPGEWFFGDNITVSFADRYYISNPNHVLFVYAWNDDDTSDHVFQFRVGQASDPAIISSYLPAAANADLAESIAAIIAEQDQSYAAQRARAIAAAEALPEETI